MNHHDGSEWGFGSGSNLNQYEMPSAGPSNMNIFNQYQASGSLAAQTSAMALNPALIAQLPYAVLLQHHSKVCEVDEDLRRATTNLMDQTQAQTTLLRENADMKKEIQELVIAKEQGPGCLL